MRTILIILLMFFPSISNSQIIPFQDINFKNKLLQANTTNTIAISNNNNPMIIDINGNNEIEVSEAVNVYRLYVQSSSISNISGIEFFVNLELLYINQNSLSNVNISTLTHLKILRCDLNMLSSLDLTGLTELEGVNISYNNFSSFNLSNLPNLKGFVCQYNNLTTLDFSNNPLLSVLQCRNNNLSTLIIKNGINQDFSITGNNDCWKTGNPNLTTICVDESELASVQTWLNGCDTATPTPVITSSNCGLANETFEMYDVFVFPNPTTSNINININSTIKTIELYDFQGRLLLSKTVNTNQTTLDVSGYSKGIYFVKVESEKGSNVEKIIKE